MSGVVRHLAWRLACVGHTLQKSGGSNIISNTQLINLHFQSLGLVRGVNIRKLGK